ncbi:MAG: ABC transporter permease [Verrucomicrobia bacterium]|nr:ABC transporter permease [Verrucomicrobiota bacterium]
MIPERCQKIILPIAAGILILSLWSGIKAWFQLPAFLLPGPSEVLQAGWNERHALTTATWTTFRGAGLGFIMAVGVGFCMSLLLVSVPWLRQGLYPYIIFMQMVPIIATAAIIVIWLDVGIQSVAAIAFLIGFFPVVASTLQGLLSTPVQQVELFRMYRASRWQELFLLRVPASLPYFFTGAKIAATLAVIGSVTGEIFAGSSSGGGGLGFMIIIYKSSLRIPALFAATFICCILGFIFVGTVLYLKWLALNKWHDSLRNEDV